VRETELDGDGTPALQNDDVVMIARPIKGGEVRVFSPLSVHMTSGTHRLRTARLRRTDT
jgi:hypothetical protein